MTIELCLLQYVCSQVCRQAIVLPPGSNKYTQPKLAAEE
jgi:hypothetical protein